MNQRDRLPLVECTFLFVHLNDECISLDFNWECNARELSRRGFQIHFPSGVTRSHFDRDRVALGEKGNTKFHSARPVFDSKRCLAVSASTRSSKEEEHEIREDRRTARES